MSERQLGTLHRALLWLVVAVSMGILAWGLARALEEPEAPERPPVGAMEETP